MDIEQKEIFDISHRRFLTPPTPQSPIPNPQSPIPNPHIGVNYDV